MISLKNIRNLAASVILGFGVLASATALAQTIEPPPQLTLIDQNGVNLATGQFAMPNLDLSIGNENTGLVRQTLSNSDNYSGVVTLDSVYLGEDGIGPLFDFYMEVSFGGNLYRFRIGGEKEHAPYLRPGPYAEYGTLKAMLECSAEYTLPNDKTGNCTLILADGTRAVYDMSLLGAQLVSIAKPDGEQISISYHMGPIHFSTGARAIKSVTSSLGWVLKYDVDTDFKVTKVTAYNKHETYCEAEAACASAAYSPQIETVSTGQTKTILKNGASVISYVVDGDVITLTNPRGVVKTVTLSEGKVSTVAIGGSTWTYNSSPYSTGKTSSSVTSPNGKRRSIISNRYGVERYTDEYGRVTHWVYDYQGRVVRVINPDATFSGVTLESVTGGFTEYVYGVRNNITETKVYPKSGGTPIITTATYTALCNTANEKYCNKPLTVTDPNGVTTTLTYEDFGGVKTTTRPAVNNVRAQTRYYYSQITPQVKNASGVLVNELPVWRLVATKSCMTQDLGGCAGTADELVATTTYSTQNALPIATTSQRGDGTLVQSTAFAYDLRGNLKETDGPKAGIADKAFVFYDAVGRQIGVIGNDPDGDGPRLRLASRSIYADDGQVREEISGTVSGTTEAHLNALTVLERNTNEFSPTTGLPIRAKYFAGTATEPQAVTERSYDNMLRVECEAQRLNPDIFDALTSTAPNACALEASGPDGPDRVTKYAYDDGSQVVRVTAAYGTTEVADDVVKTFSTCATCSGQLLSVADAKGNKTVYEYDSFNRLVKTIYPQAANGQVSNVNDFEQTTYLGARVLAHTFRDGQTIVFDYDAIGRISSKSVGGSVIATTTYNNFDQVLTRSENGQTSSYGYNAMGWLLTDAQPLGTITYEYDDYGRRSRMWWPGNTFSVTYAYNAGDELTGIYENGTSALTTFDFDDFGRRWHVYRANGQTTTYNYDTSSRLTGLTQPSNTFGFSYTVAEQVKTRGLTNTNFAFRPTVDTINYTSNGLNQIASINGANLTYDLRGNLTGDGGGVYGYNISNLLVTVTQSEVTTTLGYDAENRLLSIAKPGIGATKFLYDGADIIAEFDENNNLLRRHIHGPGTDEPMVTYELPSGVRYYLHADQQGSVVTITNNDGTVVNTTAYSEYGLRTATGYYASRFGYTGQVWLPEIGMYYYKARLYNPVLGRFMQTDPIGYGDGMNWYAYVGNDPVNGTDPTGLSDASESVPDCANAPPNSSAEIRCRITDCTGSFWCSVWNGFLGRDHYGQDGVLTTYVRSQTQSIPQAAFPFLPSGNSMTPPPNIPGGPWTPNPHEAPGTFDGPKQQKGGRARLRYVPKGAVSNNKKPYWKVNRPGVKGWQRYNLRGKEISEKQAHPGNPRLVLPSSPGSLGIPVIPPMLPPAYYPGLFPQTIKGGDSSYVGA